MLLPSRIAVCASLIVAWSVVVSAQSDAVHLQPGPASKAHGAIITGSDSRLQSELQPLRVAVDLVLVPVTVTNLRNQPVTTLEKNNFQVYENDRPQEIRYFSIEDEPISVGLILDVSRSMRNNIEIEKAAVREFFNNGNPEDDYFAITFANRPKLLANPTQSIGTLEARLGEVKAEGNTALLDAVSLGVSKLHSAQYRRRALLIISDGGDNNSRYRLNEVKSLVQESDVMVYAIAIFDQFNLPLFKSLDEKMRKRWLDEITEASGGRTLVIDNLARVPEIAAEVSREIRTQYVLGYEPSNPVRERLWRRIKVRVTGVPSEARLQAFHKQGYGVPPSR